MSAEFEPTHEIRAMGRIFRVCIIGNIAYTSNGGKAATRVGGGTWMFRGKRVDYLVRKLRPPAVAEEMGQESF